MEYDISIIGAGVTGALIARELSKFDMKVCILDKDADVAMGTSKANSAIVHAGYDAIPGTLKAKLNTKGNPMFDKVCEELDVPFKRIGSLVIASNEEEMESIEELYKKGIENGIPNMKILSQKEVREKEENISEEIIGALFAPTAAIVSPWEIAVALAENASDNGTEIRLESKVTDIQKVEDGYCLNIGDETINAKQKGAVDSLVFSDKAIQDNEQKMIDFLNDVESKGVKMYSVDSSTDIGLRVTGLGGIISLLRYAVES